MSEQLAQECHIIGTQLHSAENQLLDKIVHGIRQEDIEAIEIERNPIAERFDAVTKSPIFMKLAGSVTDHTPCVTIVLSQGQGLTHQDIEILHKLKLKTDALVEKLNQQPSPMEIRTGECMDNIFSSMIHRSGATRRLVEKYIEAGKKLGFIANKMNFSFDLSDRHREQFQLESKKLAKELKARWLDPILVCYSDARDQYDEETKTWKPVDPNAPENKRVQKYCYYNKKYESKIIRYHFHGQAETALPPEKRMEFKGEHYTTVALNKTDFIMTDDMSTLSGLDLLIQPMIQCILSAVLAGSTLKMIVCPMAALIFKRNMQPCTFLAVDFMKWKVFLLFYLLLLYSR